MTFADVPQLPPAPEGDLTLGELDFPLPDSAIARTPAEPRDRARLLVLDRSAPGLRHLRFRHLPALLRAGDLLVLNDTRVLPARFHVRRSTGGRLEGLYLSTAPDGLWHVLLKGAARVDPGERLRLDPSAGADLRSPQRPQPSAEPPVMVAVRRLDGGEWQVRVEPAIAPEQLADWGGLPPLPPYIRKARAEAGTPLDDPADAVRYQTVYADRAGAVAAPTAGLHLTPEVLDELADAGVGTVTVTLHVGAGTFAPASAARLSAHPMHAEDFEVSPAARDAVAATRAAGGRVIAVGTTAARTLETAAVAAEREPSASVPHGDMSSGLIRAGKGRTRLLISPGWRFRVVQGLVTNFHLPRTTLPALVFALAGRERTLSAYAEALARGYRFFSFGDAMLVL